MADYKTDDTWIQLQSAPLDVEAATVFLRVPAAGGIDLFLGTTRQWTDGRETTRLEYECYEPMALREMLRLAKRVRERWPAERVCLLHRLGLVPPAESSVVIGVATPHRAEAFAACRFMIDTLKTQVPIWKREVYADGHAEWITGDARPALASIRPEPASKKP